MVQYLFGTNRLAALPRAETINEGGDRLDRPRRPSTGSGRRTSSGRGGSVLTRSLFCLLSLAALLWLAVFIHPETRTAVSRPLRRTDLSQRVDTAFANAAAEALASLTVGEDGEEPALPIPRKIYKIDEDAVLPPAPDPEAFGVTEDPAEVQAVVERAAPLLEGQELSWSPDIELAEGSHLAWYYDESILAIAWKEEINDTVCSFIEVKLADGSQLRRTLAGGTYSSNVAHYATEMARSSNAVVAINGDFYTFRVYGITVYQRQIYRNAPEYVDTAYFTSSGDMIFSHRGELAGEGEAQRFVEDNDVVFSAAFGPVMVENGEKCDISGGYAIGDFNIPRSRSIIAQKDTLHYLLLNLNWGAGAATMEEVQQIIYERNVQSAYNLDGGQTAVLVLNGETFNRVDYGAERTMSDIIYFATAIPEDERSS